MFRYEWLPEYAVPSEVGPVLRVGKWGRKIYSGDGWVKYWTWEVQDTGPVGIGGGTPLSVRYVGRWVDEWYKSEGPWFGSWHWFFRSDGYPDDDATDSSYQPLDRSR